MDCLSDKIIENYGKGPYIYLKFCSKEKYAKDVCDGNLYANTAKYYRDLENQNGSRGLGDKNELVSRQKYTNLRFLDSNSKQEIIKTGKADVRYSYNLDDYIPIVSFVGITVGDLVIKDVKESYVECSFAFDKDEYALMMKEFGEYCVVLSANELNVHIEKVCEFNNVNEYRIDAVKYCLPDLYEKELAFRNKSIERFYYKDLDLKYQKEYRFVAICEMPEDHYLKVDKLDSASILDSNEVKNIVLRFHFDKKAIDILKKC